MNGGGILLTLALGVFIMKLSNKMLDMLNIGQGGSVSDLSRPFSHGMIGAGAAMFGAARLAHSKRVDAKADTEKANARAKAETEGTTEGTTTGGSGDKGGSARATANLGKTQKPNDGKDMSDVSPKPGEPGFSPEGQVANKVNEDSKGRPVTAGAKKAAGVVGRAGLNASKVLAGAALLGGSLAAGTMTGNFSGARNIMGKGIHGMMDHARKAAPSVKAAAGALGQKVGIGKNNDQYNGESGKPNSQMGNTAKQVVAGDENAVQQDPASETAPVDAAEAGSSGFVSQIGENDDGSDASFEYTPDNMASMGMNDMVEGSNEGTGLSNSSTIDGDSIGGSSNADGFANGDSADFHTDFNRDSNSFASDNPLHGSEYEQNLARLNNAFTTKNSGAMAGYQQQGINGVASDSQGNMVIRGNKSKMNISGIKPAQGNGDVIMGRTSTKNLNASQLAKNPVQFPVAGKAQSSIYSHAAHSPYFQKVGSLNSNAVTRSGVADTTGITQHSVAQKQFSAQTGFDQIQRLDDAPGNQYQAHISNDALNGSHIGNSNYGQNLQGAISAFSNGDQSKIQMYQNNGLRNVEASGDGYNFNFDGDKANLVQAGMVQTDNNMKQVMIFKDGENQPSGSADMNVLQGMVDVNGVDAGTPAPEITKTAAPIGLAEQAESLDGMPVEGAEKIYQDVSNTNTNNNQMNG